MICLDGFYGIFRSSAAHPRNENGVAGVCEKNSLILGLISLAFLGVLGALAVNVLSRINRQDAKSAKNFAKQNSFQVSKNRESANSADKWGRI